MMSSLVQHHTSRPPDPSISRPPTEQQQQSFSNSIKLSHADSTSPPSSSAVHHASSTSNNSNSNNSNNSNNNNNHHQHQQQQLTSFQTSPSNDSSNKYVYHHLSHQQAFEQQQQHQDNNNMIQVQHHLTYHHNQQQQQQQQQQQVPSYNHEHTELTRLQLDSSLSDRATYRPAEGNNNDTSATDHEPLHRQICESLVEHEQHSRQCTSLSYNDLPESQSTFPPSHLSAVNSQSLYHHETTDIHQPHLHHHHHHQHLQANNHNQNTSQQQQQQQQHHYSTLTNDNCCDQSQYSGISDNCYDHQYISDASFYEHQLHMNSYNDLLESQIAPTSHLLTPNQQQQQQHSPSSNNNNNYQRTHNYANQSSNGATTQLHELSIESHHQHHHHHQQLQLSYHSNQQQQQQCSNQLASHNYLHQQQQQPPPPTTTTTTIDTEQQSKSLDENNLSPIVEDALGYTSLQQLSLSCENYSSEQQVSTTSVSISTSSSSLSTNGGQVDQVTSINKLRSIKGRRGRPRKKGSRSKNKINGKLWEFIRDLLLNERTNPSFIRWERREDGVFKFVQSDKVAKMWGERKQNPKMTYEKLSRAMRYYYKSKVLLPVFGRRLVYKFGPNATGWLPEGGNSIITLSAGRSH